MNKRIITACDKVIQYGLAFMGVLIVLSLSLSSFDMLQLKATTLQMGSAIVFSAWLLKILNQGFCAFHRSALPLIGASVLWVASALASHLFVAQATDLSFDELMVRIPYFLVFIVVITEFAEFHKVKFMALVMTLSAVIAGLFGMLQHFKFDPFGLAESFEWRIPSTFANPNFYVGYLVLLIPLVAAWFPWSDARHRKGLRSCIMTSLGCSVLYYLITLFFPQPLLRAALLLGCMILLLMQSLYKGLGLRTFFVFALTLLTLNILLTQSRSGQIGLAINICAFVFLLVLFFWQTKRWKKIALLSSVVLTLSVITLTGVLHIGNQREHSVSERKFYVLGALDLIKQRPLVGHGIGTFQVNYPRVKRVEAWAYDAVCFQYVRNVYNELLEIWHDEGIVGLVLFMTLLWMVVSRGIGTLARHGAQQHHSTDPALLGKAEFIIAALSAIAGLVVSNAFSLSMRYVSTGLPFWVLMGMLSATASADSAVVKFPLRIRLTGDTDGAKRPAIHHWVLLGGHLLVVFGLCLVIFWYGRLFLADCEMAKAIAHSKQAYGVVSEDESTLFHDIYKEGTLYHSDMQEWEKAIGAYLKVLRLNPHNLRAHYMLANAFNRRELTQKQYAPQWGDRNGIARTDIDRALEHYGYVIQQAPNYAEVDYEIGTAYMKAGAIDSAIAAYNDYARYRRFFTKIHYALAQAFVAKRDWESAEKAYDEVLELNAQFTRAYLEQNAVCRMQGKDALADDYYHKAEELSADYAKTTIIDIYESLNGWHEALEHIDYALEQTPRDASLIAKKGWMYIQLNNYPLALQAYRQAISLDSSNVLCFINLSNLYYTLDDLDNAKATLERALALDSNAVKCAVQRAGNGR